jgi:hypothetical protein
MGNRNRVPDAYRRTRRRADHQRRLLYNAISRAEYNCTVMVRTRLQLQQAPFV